MNREEFELNLEQAIEVRDYLFSKSEFSNKFEADREKFFYSSIESKNLKFDIYRYKERKSKLHIGCINGEDPQEKYEEIMENIRKSKLLKFIVIQYGSPTKSFII